MIIEHIKELEKIDNPRRVKYVKKYLDSIGINYQIQKCKGLFLTGENVIVDIPASNISTNKKLLISAHTNKFLKSPGANDNATGVAILLQIINALKGKSLNKNLRFVFFDLEDGGAQRVGSKAYVRDYGYRDLDFVLNVDMVGVGDTIIVEGIKQSNQSAYLRKLLRAVKQNDLHVWFMEKPYYGISQFKFPFFVSDHSTFLMAGFEDVCGITCDFKKDLWYYKLMGSEKWSTWLSLWIKHFIDKTNSPLPFKIQHYHNQLDTSKFIDINHLEKVYDIVLRVILDK